MKKALAVVWVWALLWNGYATWMWADGFARVGFPRSLHVHDYVVILGPAISFVALLWAPQWRRQLSSGLGLRTR
jgi:hypothetical protein